LKNSSVRVLIVDDFGPWQGLITHQLGQQPRVRVIGSASDGLEAVQKAEELQPDLILLDVGLPKLNGIEVARQLRRSVPKAKIIFLSSDSDPDVVRTAFLVGGCGYVLKSDAAGALWPGMEAVLLGRQFVSPSLAHVNDVPAEQE
jgi:DNA-binding NarL/FixJ family response regulator